METVYFWLFRNMAIYVLTAVYWRAVSGTDCGDSKLTVKTDNICLSLSPLVPYSRIPGSTIHYSCASILGTLSRSEIDYCPVEICRDNGTWSTPSLSCAANECFKSGKSEMYNGRRTCTGSGYPCKRWPDHKMQDHMYCRDPGGEKGAPWCHVSDTSLPNTWEFCDIPLCTDLPLDTNDCKGEGDDEKIQCDFPNLMVKVDHDCTAIKSLPVTSLSLGSTIHFRCSYLQVKLTSSVGYCPVQVCQDEGKWTSASISCAESECFLAGYSDKYRGKRSCTRSGKPCQPWSSQYPHAHTLKGTSFPDGSLKMAGSYCRDPDRSRGSPWCYTLDPEIQWEDCSIYRCGDIPLKSTKCSLYHQQLRVVEQDSVDNDLSNDASPSEDVEVQIGDTKDDALITSMSTKYLVSELDGSANPRYQSNIELSPTVGDSNGNHQLRDSTLYNDELDSSEHEQKRTVKSLTFTKSHDIQREVIEYKEIFSSYQVDYSSGFTVFPKYRDDTLFRRRNVNSMVETRAIHSSKRQIVITSSYVFRTRVFTEIMTSKVPHDVETDTISAKMDDSLYFLESDSIRTPISGRNSDAKGTDLSVMFQFTTYQKENRGESDIIGLLRTQDKTVLHGKILGRVRKESDVRSVLQIIEDRSLSNDESQRKVLDFSDKSVSFRQEGKEIYENKFVVHSSIHTPQERVKSTSFNSYVSDVHLSKIYPENTETVSNILTKIDVNIQLNSHDKISRRQINSNLNSAHAFSTPKQRILMNTDNFGPMNSYLNPKLSRYLKFTPTDGTDDTSLIGQTRTGVPESDGVVPPLFEKELTSGFLTNTELIPTLVVTRNLQLVKVSDARSYFVIDPLRSRPEIELSMVMSGKVFVTTDRGPYKSNDFGTSQASNVDISLKSNTNGIQETSSVTDTINLHEYSYHNEIQPSYQLLDDLEDFQSSPLLITHSLELVTKNAYDNSKRLYHSVENDQMVLSTVKDVFTSHGPNLEPNNNNKTVMNMSSSQNTHKPDKNMSTDSKFVSSGSMLSTESLTRTIRNKQQCWLNKNSIKWNTLSETRWRFRRTLDSYLQVEPLDKIDTVWDELSCARHCSRNRSCDIFTFFMSGTCEFFSMKDGGFDLDCSKLNTRFCFVRCM